MQLMVFDVAGTTLRDDGDHVAGFLAHVLKQADVPTSLQAIDLVMGLPKPTAIAQLIEAHRGRTQHESEVRDLHDRFRSLMIDHYAHDPDVAETPGASEVFAGLRAMGVRVALDTGFDRGILNAVIQRLQWGQFLDDTIASDEVAHGRPEPDMIHALMARSGVDDPAMVGKVGDSISDILEGRNARCGLVAAIRNARTHQAIGSTPGVVGIENIAEVVPLIEARLGLQPEA